jgi:hypothetical protein
MEGIGLNAAARVFGYAKTTILNWEKKLSGLQETLFLYALGRVINQQFQIQTVT